MQIATVQDKSSILY